MPFTYKIDTSLGLIFYSGFDTNASEMLQAETAASADPLRLPSMKIIIDLSKAKLDVSLADIREGIKMNRKRMEKGDVLEPTAIVSHSRFIKVLGETFRLLSEGLPIHFSIFSTLSDAIRWLGLSDKEAEIFEMQKEIMDNLKKNAVI